MKTYDLILHDGSYSSLELIPVPHVIYKHNLSALKHMGLSKSS